MAAVPYTIHTVLTDNRWSEDHRYDLRSRRGQEAAKGTQFVDCTPINEEAEAEAEAFWAERDEPRLYRLHAFASACEQNGIEHRLTKPRCPWTNGQVERMNRTIKDATVKRYHYGSHDELRRHLQLFVDAYNYGRRLKTLRGLTPYEFVCKP